MVAVSWWCYNIIGFVQFEGRRGAAYPATFGGTKISSGFGDRCVHFCAGYLWTLTCLKCSPYKNATLHRSICLMKWVVSSLQDSATRSQAYLDRCKPWCTVSNSCSFNDSILGFKSSIHHHNIPARDACYCRQVLWRFVQQSEGLFDTCY